jgi:Fic family protein
MAEDSILRELEKAREPLPVSDLEARTNIPRRTLQRQLRRLVDSGQVNAIGQGRARRYELPAVVDIDEYFSRPHTERPSVGWEPSFLEDYAPNSTYYLNAATRAALHEFGSPTTTLPAGTYARRILDRLLIDLSWNSSRLEGNTYSLLETEELLLRGREAEGHSAVETQMVLNHKSAIEFLVESSGDLELSPLFVRNLHALLSENLLADPAAGGRLRKIPVKISGSSYIPLANPQRLTRAFDMLLRKAATIEDPFESAFFVLVQVPYLQPFVDVNKRVSRLAANIPFILGNYYPLSFLDTPRDEYLRAVLAVYELNETQPLAELFVAAYRRSAEKYAVIAQSLGEPDPLRMRFRGELKEVVAHVVRNLVPDDELVELPAALGLDIPSEAREEFDRLVREELAALHEGNFARYRLRPSEFERWKREGP